MPNRSSHAGHIAQRSCVVCRQKTEITELIRFAVIMDAPVFDLFRRLPSRGYYVCDDNECLEKLKIWISRNRKKLKSFRKNG